MSHPFVRRTTATLAGAALAAGALAASAPAPAAHAVPDEAPALAGTAWLTGQLTGGVIHNDQYNFDDLGLTMDTGFALAAVGDTATVDEIEGALAPRESEVYSYPVFGTGGASGDTHISAGSLAKLASFVQVAGGNASDVNGTDLIGKLEQRVSTDPATAGRIGDAFFPEVEGSYEADYSNVIGQAYAANALDTAGSLKAEDATNFLLGQQCAEGWFRLNFSAADAADQTCDGDATAEPDTDVTALAILQLAGQSDDTDVQPAVEAALAWLVDSQRANGSFGGGPSTEAPNANSTGLAAWALGELGTTAEAQEAAEDAAAWVRARQADDTEPCATALTAEAGAIAYDPAAKTTGRTDGITVATQDQWRRTTAQALPGLIFAPPADVEAAQPSLTQRWVSGGKRATLLVAGVAPGDTVCAARGGNPAGIAEADLSGLATVKAVTPKATGRYTYVLSNGESELRTLRVQVLGKAELRIKARKVFERGTKRTVKATGLVKGEPVVFKLGKKRLGKTTANAKGVAKLRVKIKVRPGRKKLTARGAFANRKGAKTVRVIR